MSYVYTTITDNTAVNSGWIVNQNATGINWDTVTVTSGTQHNTLEVKGDANIEGDLTVKGKSISDSLERIEERLAILRPNEELEEKWENLRGLRKAYMDLEKEILEKEKVWGILKK